MKFFIDTANIQEIKEISKWGILDGVTTNPSLIAKEGRDLKEVINEICSLLDGPISAEVISVNCDDMIKEAEELCSINKNIVIKIPMIEEGIKAVKVLHEKNIKTNVTLIFSAQQALIAAKAGASYVSPFVGRLDDIGDYGVDIIRDISEIFNIYDIDTEIIAASIRNSNHVLDCAKVGADIATVPYKILKQMIKHPLTDIGLEKFLKDYNNTAK
ncbi:fructose-6-phosphate aldolase [Clostridium niameyense]|uniref:Probable transaldolase n=1 Tax=Clostridium niameyense TaxID=1622073 RepID=A0A6M0RAR3_9CLOT|nr:fructose-6-phosphate aldolase [Clostridium niameyense]NEZ47354.1 fructose-6-phosphate aldolase [Clostridium niameyense]